MSTPQKRAREAQRDEKAREKNLRRREKRHLGSAEPELVTADQIAGNLRSIEDVMSSLFAGKNTVERSAAPIPTKLFVGSLSDETSNASLRAHFAPHAEIAEAVVITDRATGASRNFGFVTVADRKDAPGVIDALHHSELDGARIVVNVATERR
jgi:RNA recognition motif-containing protein